MTKNLNIFLLIVLFLTVILFTGCGSSSSGNDSSATDSTPTVSDNPPTAVATANPTTGNAPLEVNFEGSSSTDDNGIVRYSWDFGDGTSETGLSVSHTYTDAGSYMVTLTVTDSQGQIDTAQLPINVIDTVVTFAVVDTGQMKCFDNFKEIPCPSAGSAFYGQDSQYDGFQPSYKDNGDGTVTDFNTGLMWIKDAGNKAFYYDAINAAYSFEFAGYNDWRVPTIKELYSLIDFSGVDIDPMSTTGGNPFINDDIFVFEYGNTSSGDRIIDSQWITTNIYVDKVMNNQECFFGVNFADGRIKCYPTQSGGNNGYFLRLVRGASYGVNSFADNGDGTITDASSGLMWQKEDNGEGIDWEDALKYCENLESAGYADWRLPNAKELQFIVDYTRSPDTTNTAAINPLFEVSEIVNEAGDKDYPFFWTSTTHKNSGGGENAVYISFGRALGYFNNEWIDVHGAGAQRSDPKSGDPDDYPTYRGPQGDVCRVFNYTRCVRNIN